jgi:hypothetical protein
MSTARTTSIGTTRTGTKMHIAYKNRRWCAGDYTHSTRNFGVITNTTEIDDTQIADAVAGMDVCEKCAIEINHIARDANRRFLAVTYNGTGEPIAYWLGTQSACLRFVDRERSQDERVTTHTITQVAESMTWEQARDQTFVPDPDAQGRVLWSGTWTELERHA